MPGFNIGGNPQREPSNVERDPYRAHRWRIRSLGASTGGSIFTPPSLALYVKSLTLPSFNIEEEVVIGASVKYKFAKLASFEDVTISFYDTSGIYESIVKWQNDVWDREGGIQLAERYKRESTFCLTDAGGADTGTLFKLKGSWPKQISHSALTYDSSELKLINLVLSYDWAEFSNKTTQAAAGLTADERAKLGIGSGGTPPVTPSESRQQRATTGRGELPAEIQRQLNRPLSREAGRIRVK